MSMQDMPYIIVLGNEKGGSGKTTTSMHLIFALLHKGYTVSCLDLDVRQLSLRRYLENRANHCASKVRSDFLMPNILELPDAIKSSCIEATIEAHYSKIFVEQKTQFIVIDTPGSNTLISCVAHSFADLIITPINDSFIDIDLIAKVDGDNMKCMTPSIYSSMIWEQKIKRNKRDKSRINWVVIRNRLSNLDSNNRRNIETALGYLGKNLAFRVGRGFSERIIYRELFPYGLTLLDIFDDNQTFVKVTPSHIAARQELKSFLNELKIPLLNGDDDWRASSKNYDLYKEIENSNVIINLTDKVTNET